MERLFTINPCPRPMEKSNTIIETLPTSSIPLEDRDIYVFKELLGNDTPPIPEDESSNFDHHDNPSFPRPPSEPPDVEIFFKPDLGVLTPNVVKGIFEHYVLMPNILPTLPTFDPFYPVYDTLLPFLSENKDKVFKLDFKINLIVFGPDISSAPASFSSGGRGEILKKEKVRENRERMRSRKRKREEKNKRNDMD
nr:hypothetical protein [Tanacetum cinerariifolium]